MGRGSIIVGIRACPATEIVIRTMVAHWHHLMMRSTTTVTTIILYSTKFRTQPFGQSWQLACCVKIVGVIVITELPHKSCSSIIFLIPRKRLYLLKICIPFSITLTYSPELALNEGGFLHSICTPESFGKCENYTKSRRYVLKTKP